MYPFDFVFDITALSFQVISGVIDNLLVTFRFHPYSLIGVGTW